MNGSDVLHLGCGVRPRSDAINHDFEKHSEWVDVAWDLNDVPWSPFESESFGRIVSLDVFEHLKIDVQAWLDECWRILTSNGVLIMRVAAWDNPVSYRDPTHNRVFHEQTFDFWDRRKQLHQDYGSFYFGKSARWWTVEMVERTNGGDLGFVLRKEVGTAR